MKRFSIVLLIFCVLSIILITILLYKYNSIWINNIEKKITKFSNILNGIGVIFGIISLAIAAIAFIYSMQESKINIEFLTAHYDAWNRETSHSNLILCEDSDGHISYQISMPDTWYIKLQNNGNKRAENIKVNITFSGIGFYKQPYDYQLVNHIHALGSFATLEWEYDGLNPEDNIILPSIPFNCAIDMNTFMNSEDFKKLKNTEMDIVIWIDNVKRIIK